MTQLSSSPPQDMISGGCGQILSLVEDALAVGFEGHGQFALNPVVVDPREDIIMKSWEQTRMQKRFAEKIKVITMELIFASPLPHSAAMDPHRSCQVVRPRASPWPIAAQRPALSHIGQAHPFSHMHRRPPRCALRSAPAPVPDHEHHRQRDQIRSGRPREDPGDRLLRSRWAPQCRRAGQRPRAQLRGHLEAV